MVDWKFNLECVNRGYSLCIPLVKPRRSFHYDPAHRFPLAIVQPRLILSIESTATFDDAAAPRLRGSIAQEINPTRSSYRFYRGCFRVRQCPYLVYLLPWPLSLSPRNVTRCTLLCTLVNDFLPFSAFPFVFVLVYIRRSINPRPRSIDPLAASILDRRRVRVRDFSKYHSRYRVCGSDRSCLWARFSEAFSAVRASNTWAEGTRLWAQRCPSSRVGFRSDFGIELFQGYGLNDYRNFFYYSLAIDRAGV